MEENVESIFIVFRVGQRSLVHQRAVNGRRKRDEWDGLLVSYRMFLSTFKMSKEQEFFSLKDLCSLKDSPGL